MKKKLYLLFLGLGLLAVALIPKASAQSASIPYSEEFTNTTASTWIVPAGVTSVTVECYGAGGGGATSKRTYGAGDKVTYNTPAYGGGGGAYAKSVLTVSPGTTYYICAGAGGAGGYMNGNAVVGPTAGSASWFSTSNSANNAVVSAAGGGAGAGAQGAGGLASSSTGDTKYSGGKGGDYGADVSGGGGACAGPDGAGSDAFYRCGGATLNGESDCSSVAHSAGGYAGAGADGVIAERNGANGYNYGGGGSGAGFNNGNIYYTGGAGAQGVVKISYNVPLTVKNYSAILDQNVTLSVGLESSTERQIHWYDHNNSDLGVSSSYSFVKGANERDTFYVQVYNGSTPLTDRLMIMVNLVDALPSEGVVPFSLVLDNTGAATEFVVPAGVDTLFVECYGAGGSGGKGGGQQKFGCGGGGGAYAAKKLTVTAGTTYYYYVGAGTAGNAGGNSWFSTTNNVNNALVKAAGGSAGNENAVGAGGTVANSTGDTKNAGGSGGSRSEKSYPGAGGGAAGPGGAGYTASGYTAGQGNGGLAGAGAEGSADNPGLPGNIYGGGGSGGYNGGAGGVGAQGAVVITYNVPYNVENYSAVLDQRLDLGIGLENSNRSQIHWYDNHNQELGTGTNYTYFKGPNVCDTFWVQIYDGSTPLTDKMRLLVNLISSPDIDGPLTLRQAVTSTTSTVFTVPDSVTSLTVECYGGGGGGMAGKKDVKSSGGGGGAYAASTFSVIPGTTYYVCAGQGGAAGRVNNNNELVAPSAGNGSWFSSTNADDINTATVYAAGGSYGSANSGGYGGYASNSKGDTKYSGGRGGAPANNLSGAGGGAAGPAGDGGNASGGTAGTGNGGNAGNGASGVSAGHRGLSGNLYGGGGGAGYSTDNNSYNGGGGSQGVVYITYRGYCQVQDYEAQAEQFVDMSIGVESFPGCEIYWFDQHKNYLDTRSFLTYQKTMAVCDTFYVQIYDGAMPRTSKMRILVHRICPDAPDGYSDAMPIAENCWLLENVPGSQDSLFTFSEVDGATNNGCPYGWYLPSKAEVQSALDDLKSSFTYPGYYNGDNSQIDGKGVVEFFWTRDNLDPNNSSRDDILYVTDDCDKAMESPRTNDSSAYSIRCVQDPTINLNYRSYKFAVSDHDSVFFSQGNLQYLASTNTWKFATEQYDYVGNSAGNTTPMPDRATQNNWIDLYGWGTSGWDNGNLYYQPYDVDVLTSSYGCYDADDYGYGPVLCPSCSTGQGGGGQGGAGHAGGGQDASSGDHSNLDLTPDFTPWEGSANALASCMTAEERAVYAQSDWGQYIGSEIINGGRDDWRTLTLAEWDYLMKERYDAANKQSQATVNGVNGIIFLPEFWDWNNVPNIQPFNITYEYADNVYTISEWRRMEYYGAMFLPAAGHRNLSGKNNLSQATATTVYEAGEKGEYWASTAHPGSDGCAHPITFVNGSNIATTASHTHDRAVGRCVRLARNCATGEYIPVGNN